MYWVPETNLLLLTLESYASIPDGHNLQSSHGPATADAIGQACPDCYVLVIQDWNNIDGGAMQAIAADYPWVDLATSTSYGFNNVEYGEAAATEGYAHGTRALHDRGGLAFAPTGNGILTPNAQVGVTYSLHFVNMPPWVVLVGGSESVCNGVPWDGSKPVEMVSDFTQDLALHDGANSTGLVAGTSFATPRVAGLFAQTLLTVRQALDGSAGQGALWHGDPRPGIYLEDGRLTNEELRTALREVAIHYATTDFVVPCPLGPPQRIPIGPGPVPVSPTPWIEMGWGHLGPDQAAAAAANILSGTQLARDGSTVAWGQGLDAARASMYPW